MSYQEIKINFSPLFPAHFSLVDGIEFKEKPPLPIPAWVTLKQVHGTQGYEQRKTELHSQVDGDWHYTYEKNLGLGIFVADCTAILISGMSQGKNFVAALHAGWRGTAQGIIEKSLQTLKPEKGFHVWLSPSICAEQYEVDQNVIDQFPSAIEKYITKTRPGHYFLDLKSYQISLLQNYSANIWASSLCTSLQPEFFSYRASKGQLSGRHLAWIRM